MEATATASTGWRGTAGGMRYLLAAAMLLAAACGRGGGQAPAAAPELSPTPRLIAAPAPQSRPTTPPPVSQGWRDLAAAVMITPVDDTAPTWSEAFILPYGDAPEQPGNGLGLEPLAEHYGPSLATVDAAGRWWVADTYKERVALFGAGGTYLGSVELSGTGPLEGLAVFDDGRAVATTAAGTWLTVGSGGVAFRSGTSDTTIAFSDGARAYGWEPWSDELRAVRLDGDSPTSERVNYFTTRAGNRFAIDYVEGHDDVVVVTLPDADPPTRVALRVRSETGRKVFVSVEPDADQAGNVHLLLLGYAEPAPEDDPEVARVPRAAHVVVSPDGDVLANREVPDPFGEFDYGLPHRFVVAPADGRAHLVVAEADGLHIWRSAHAWATTPRILTDAPLLPAGRIPGD